MLNGIDWLGHAGIRITGSKIIYIDPWKLGSNVAIADIILITHSHFDHCSPNDIAKIRKKDTLIICSADCRDKFAGPNVKTVKPGDMLTVDNVTVKAVPAYNIGKRFHPKENNWIGYLVIMDGRTVYHAGDTDIIPEMAGLNPDIAFLPIGGTYTMSAGEAAVAAGQIAPKTAVPIHYGDIVGSVNDAERFKELCSCNVEIPNMSH